MKRYVEQLLEDIGLAREMASQRLNRKLLLENKDDYFILTDNDEAGIKLSDLFQLEDFIFPRRSYLDPEEISILVSAKIGLWKAYGLNPLFPADLPDELKYCQMRNYLHEMVYPVPGEKVDVELCDYLPDYCPLSANCPIAKLHLKRSACKKRRA